MLAQKRDESFFTYWISFWPTAPMFGVAWRFEKMAPFAAFFSPSAVMAGMARAGAAEATQAVAEAAETVERAVETIEAEVAHVLSPEAAPAEAAAPEAAAPEAAAARPAALADGPAAATDDLKRIRGVGPKLEQRLKELGVRSFAQIAAMGADDRAWVEAQLSDMRPRGLPADWVEQAAALI